ncbi:tRNA-dihydrouridine synthase C [Raoultella planticola]|uniref:tRNA-dihydrouridine synthase C n=1 Tax=Raoultella planticola TaxID=575 RepID=A0A485AFB3_RAOPL|nr:tRNA-dihydrouridine synthase C [Raoultella planticola]
MREAVPDHLPVTVKIRLGWDSGARQFEIADAVEQAGATELVVHGRTKEDAYKRSGSTGRRLAKSASGCQFRLSLTAKSGTGKAHRSVWRSPAATR